jgi:hypothetical protein
MDSAKLNDWMQVIGIFAVVASLIFVGQQLRLDRQIARSDGWLQFEETQILMSDLIGQNSELWIKGLDGEELTPAERLRFDAIVSSVRARFASRFERSSMGVRGSPAELEPQKFAQEMYLHAGLRESVLRLTHRYEYSDGTTNFRYHVRQYLEKYDSGELKPNHEKRYMIMD